MKSIKLLFAILISGVLFSSCNVFLEDDYQHQISLEEIVSEYDLWYIDYNRTTGIGDIPFISRAFTLSFINGTLFANNNIVDIGRTGNGIGIDIGTYNTYNGLLETNHDIDGIADFEVSVLANNEIKIYNYRQNVNYYLIGYQKTTFNYDQLFYENIEYFLQEYTAWEKITTIGGIENTFDDENFMAFTPENITTFYSSQDAFGSELNSINWNYIGGYEIYDILGYENLKILTLSYEGGAVEEFELTVVNDRMIQLYNLNSKTIYNFSGRGFVQYLKGKKSKKEAQKIKGNEGRKRIKIVRKKKIRRNLK